MQVKLHNSEGEEITQYVQLRRTSSLHSIAMKYDSGSVGT